MKKAILLLIAIVLTLSIFIAASASLPVGTEICAEDNESSLQTATIPAQGGVGNYSKGDTSNITPVAVSADTGDNLGNPAKKMLNDTPSNESDLVKRIVDDEGREIDVVPVPGVPPEERISEPPVSLVKRILDDEGREIDVVSVPGVPPEERISGPPVSSSEITRADATLPNVPAFDWCYGCSATSAAMMFGYYDRTGYPNMYTGPTNSGVCPLDNSAWGSGECSLSATHQGFDGLAVKGHVDDYWSTFGSTVDPYDGNWTEHGYADCTADFMGTNQYVNWHNTDGETQFVYYVSGDPLCDFTGCEPYTRDGCHGIRLFVESRGYNVVQNCNQYIDPYVTGGFTYANFKAEIDAGRPVLIHVEGHTMLGYGYNDPDTIYIHDTWGHTHHSMTWGGSYSGQQHIGVTFIQLEPTGPTAPDLTVSSVNAPTSAQAGSSIAVSWTVNNQGNAASGAFNNRISLAATPYGTDISLGNYPMDPIAAGSSSSDAQVPKIPETVSPGYYYVTVFADAFNDVPDESNENNNINKAPNQIHITPYEEPDVPLTGDMNGDGRDTTGIYNPNAAEFTFNGKTVRFGEVNDEPIIGDWDDDGRDEIGVFRLREGGADQSTFHLVGRNWAELSPGDVGAADKEISFPFYAGNIPVAGDWDGDGDDDIGSYYPPECTFYLYLLDWDASTAAFYTPVSFGEPGDMPLTGDWNCDGYEDVAVYRKYDPDYNQNLVFYFDLDLTGGQHEIGPYEWGDNHHIPIAGRWEDDDGDKVGVYDPNTEKFERNKDIPPPCTCGNMDVTPTSWSPTINCGESDSQIVTVSASGGMIRGVTVSMVSVPTWLSVSPTNLRDISSGSSKTFTITASPTASLSAGTRGDFAYTVRVSNTCGSPSTRDVSGTIQADCIEPSQPPSYSNPSVSPGFGTPSTQFDYSVDVSDPDEDTVTVTLKTYDPSDGSWEDQGNRNVVGSGTASWNDLTPFEVNDKGQTAKYTFVFDDGYNSGEWGPFNGPAIETDAGFSNWDYPSTSMATEKIPVEVDISNPHGVKSAWLHYDYGDDGSEDGVTQMSLISVRSAKTEIQGGSSSGLGVKAQKIDVSGSAPLSGGGGSGVAEREGIPKSIYLYDAKTCKDVEDSDPYDPIGVTTVFSPTDSISWTWLQFNDVWSSHTVKWEWYAPNGNFHSDSTLLIQDPSDSGHYEWYKCWSGIYINGYAAAEEEGIWTVKVYLDGGHIETLYFNIEYIISDYTMCKNVQASSPYDPIERTSTFLADDEMAVSWLRLDDVTNSLNVKWKWYDPSGTLYGTWDTDTPDPADEGYDYWGWIKPGCYIYIKDYAAAGKPGLWVVKVYIDAEYIFEEEFTIYPDDGRYKCEIPAPGMGYAGDEVSFYVSAYSAYDSPTDSAKHLLDIYVPDDPTLSISPSSHDFGDKCEGETDSTTFEIWNSGTGTLTYSLSESGSWVEVNPASGSSTVEHDTITVDIDTAGLSEGSHTCDISISSNDGSGTITVTVTVVPCECEGTDTSCGIYPDCENCNEKDGCYAYDDGCEERNYDCVSNEEGCDYTYTNRHIDGWVDTGNTKWVSDPGNDCQEKEQKEQKYRDYSCSGGACTYSVTDTQWIDTGNTREKPDSGVFRNGRWILRSCNPSGAVVLYSFKFGRSTDIPVTGDWDGDGVDTIGVYRNGRWLLRNSNSAGPPDYSFKFGRSTDIPVTGDWNGDGVDTIGVRRGKQWLLRDSNSAGSLDYRFRFGRSTDIPVTGDWNGDGIDTIGVRRNGRWILRNSNSAGPVDYRFRFGRSTDIPVTDDWNGDGIDTIGVRRGKQWILRNSNSAGSPDYRFRFGRSTDIPVTGDWDGA